MDGPTHFEIGVPDADRARAFYSALFGWTFRETKDGGGWFETAIARGGLHGADDRRTIEIFFAVPDIEAAVARVRELGGEAEEPSPERPGGRYTGCRDDQGVWFGLHEPRS